MSEGVTLRCSFCNKTQDEVQKLIAGPAVYICDECVDLCVDILVDEAPSIRWALALTWRSCWRVFGRWATPPTAPRPGTPT